MLVSFALGGANLVSFALGDAKVPKANGFASQWNICLRIRKLNKCLLFALEGTLCRA